MFPQFVYLVIKSSTYLLQLMHYFRPKIYRLIYVTTPGKRAQLAWLIFIFLHFWNLRFITSLWIPERTLEVLPLLSYRCLNTRSYKDRKQKKIIFNVSGQIGRSFCACPCHERAWVKKGCCLLCSVHVCI